MSFIYLSNSFILQKSKSVSNAQRTISKSKINPNTHSHSLSSTSPFCAFCGSLYYITESSSLVTSSIKPSNLYYIQEISQSEILIQMLSSIHPQDTRNIYPDGEIDPIRKKIVVRMRNYFQKFKMSISSLYLAIYVMDIILLKEKITSQHKIEQVAIGSVLIAMKYTELYMNIVGIKQFQLSFEGASFYSCDQIRKFEIFCIKKINYQLNHVTFINIVQFFLTNGIILSTDINNNSKPNMSIYFLIYQICDMVIENGMEYIQYNPFLLGCAILSLSRNLSKFDKWPKPFSKIYQVKHESFAREFSFVNDVYIKKTQMVKVKIKITRNASCNNSNNMNKLKNKGFFNSNNCNANYSNNSKFLKKIFNSRKIISRSMEMTRDISNIRYQSANSSNRNNNNNKSNQKNSNNINQINLVPNNGKVAISSVNVRLCQKGDISSSCDNKKKIKRNNSSKSQTSQKKKKPKAQSKDRKNISINLSYRTITETCSFSKGKHNSLSKNNGHHIDEYKNKISNHNISSVDSGEKSKSKLVPNPYLFSQSFNNRENNQQQSKGKNGKEMKKNFLKRKSINIIEELTMNKLSLISKIPPELKKIKRKSSFSKQKGQNENRSNEVSNYGKKQRRRISEIFSGIKKNGQLI